jgi:hypothetical protein
LGDAKPIAEVIAEWMTKSGLARRYEHKEIYAAWQETVGKDAAHCQITAVKKGVVHVLVDSATCLHEMANFRKQEILAGLQQHKGIGKVHDIEFRLGKLEQQ